MTAYYEEIMELWKEGKLSDAIRYFSQWMSLTEKDWVNTPRGLDGQHKKQVGCSPSKQTRHTGNGREY